MRYSLIIMTFVFFCLVGCKNNNPVSPQSQNLTIDNVDWIFTNHPPDINNGHLALEITLHYSGVALQPSKVSYFKMTASGITWNPPISSSNLFDSLSEISQAFYAPSLSSNASVLPIGSYNFELKLTDGSDVSKIVVLPAPGSLSNNGYNFVYTEDYSGGTASTFTRMIRRPIPNSVTKTNDSITIAFTSNDTLFYNGVIWLYNYSGNYIGYSILFRNTVTKALSNIINNGNTIYFDGITQNVVKLYPQNYYVYSPSSFNDIYSIRVVITDGIQYKDNPNYSYACKAISIMQHL